MGVEFPEYPVTMEAIADFRRRLLVPDIAAWVQVGTDVWYKIVSLGVLHRSSKYGFAFEATREHNPGEFPVDFFHLPRAKPSGFR